MPLLPPILPASIGLWRRRADLATLLGTETLQREGPAVVGWGNRPSGVRARRLTRRTGRRLVLLEDGFLLGGRGVPAASYIVDGRAVHYDAARESDLAATIRDGTFEPAELARAEAAMAMLREARLTKYNDAPILDLDALDLADRPYVLLLEQVEGDASLMGEDPSAAMLAAARGENPNHTIVIRAHPAARGRGPLAQLAGDAIVVDRACNPWPLLEGAARVYTHSSHAGFEALMAGTPVTCFGRPFYGGWGLTDDRTSEPSTERPLVVVFAAAYGRASRYLDIHDRRATTLEATIEALAALRDARAENRGHTVTVGLSPWKRRAVAPFLTGPDGSPEHARNLEAARAAAPDRIAVWGDAPTGELPAIRLEDGFVRSRGLGAALRMPLSLVREPGEHLHFDARGASEIERSLLADPPDTAERTRARALIDAIVAAGVSKYMLAGLGVDLPETDRLKVLVVGQVEDDASIRLGAPGIATNGALLAAVRALYPDALIAYRDHPDVASGLRRGAAPRDHVDVSVDDAPITALLDWCDRVETLTSATGLEALMRGRAVGTHGWPFYAGWGLTDDRLDRAPRGKASLEALAAAALIRYPRYIHPASRLPCTPERAVAAMAEPYTPTIRDRAIHPLGLVVGRLKHLLAR